MLNQLTTSKTDKSRFKRLNSPVFLSQRFLKFNQFFSVFFQELADIKASGLRSFRDIEVDDRNILIWSGLICPVSRKLSGTSFRYLRISNFAQRSRRL